MIDFLLLLVVLAAFIVVFAVLKARKPDNTAYKSAVGVALAVAFLLFWVNVAVGLIGAAGDYANLMYIGVIAVGIVGAIIARFEPHGMAHAMVATALAQALVAVIALIAFISPLSGPLEILISNGFFVALWVGSAWLFRKAAREQPPAGAGTEG